MFSYLQMAEVDFVDNLQVARKNGLQHADWPSFKSFRQNGVVGVRAGAHSNVPSL